MNNPPTRTDTPTSIELILGTTNPICAPELDDCELPTAVARAEAVVVAAFAATESGYGNVVLVVVSRYMSVLGQPWHSPMAFNVKVGL